MAPITTFSEIWTCYWSTCSKYLDIEFFEQDQFGFSSQKKTRHRLTQVTWQTQLLSTGAPHSRGLGRERLKHAPGRVEKTHRDIPWSSNLWSLESHGQGSYTMAHSHSTTIKDTLWWTNSLQLKMAIEIVDFPINSMVIFHGKLLVHQRVIKVAMTLLARWV